MREWIAGAAMLATLALTSVARAADLPPPPPQVVPATEPNEPDSGIRRFALIVVGLPGDDEHASLFRQTVDGWSSSLFETAGIPRERQFVAGTAADGLTGASSEQIDQLVNRIAEQLRTEDSLWVLFLGHGSYDGQHSWFHLPGPDLHEGNWADLFTRINCSEQVFWLTHSASGGFVRALSRPGRIVVAATEPAGELNETKFPHVLNDVLQGEPADMDADGDGRLSVLELFRATDAAVQSDFEKNELAATEHAQLDDNGDGQGSEADNLLEPGAQQTDPAAPQIDGALAAKTLVIEIPVAEESTGDDE